jgi:general secretion pathway protein A
MTTSAARRDFGGLPESGLIRKEEEVLTMSYLNYWRLQERPFENNRNTRFFYPGREHREALERLLYLVRDGNMHFGLLTGEIGSGKTMVLNQLQAKLDPKKTLSVVLPNGNMEGKDILCELVCHIENRPKTRGRRLMLAQQTHYQLLTQFSELLEERVMRMGRLLVLMIDEAQQLSDDSLTALKNLTNLGTFERNAMTVILAGQPELSERVREMPSVDQRIGLRFHLRYLSEKDLDQYLDYRMKAAGFPGESVFQPEAKSILFDYTRGIPREVNRICKLALDRSFSLGEKTVSASVVGNIATDIFHQDPMSK